jgi:hypothetical protein
MTQDPADRLPLVLALVAIALCLAGVTPFLWYVTHAPWGQGGEIQGVSLVLGTIMWVMVWAISSLLGLVLSVVTLRRSGRSGISRVAVGVNALSLAAVLVVVLLSL